MLDTVLYARDKYLKDEGVMFPSRAIMYIATVEAYHDKRNKMDFWDEVYGYDMSCIKKWVIKEPLTWLIYSE